jgi:lactate dehydrogenase-like 2-hydroxyacid dehydrogenase
MSDKAAVLQIGRLMGTLETQLKKDYELLLLAEQADPAEFLAARGQDVVGLVTSAGNGAGAQLLAKLPSLKVVSSFGVGLDKIDLAAAKARGIPVGYTPDVLNDCVADLGIALMLDIARRVSEAERFVRRGEWIKPGLNAFPLARKVSGARLGIVGFGRIGQTIAKRASGFDMEIRYHTRRPVVDVRWPHVPSLIDLARWADYLMVITAGGAGTRHLINADVLDALGPDGFIVNVARGSVIDEAALVRALVEKRIAGAGLDVFDQEPNVPAALLALDNVVLLPHIASATRETRQAMADRVAANLAAGLAGRPLPSDATA